MFKKLNEFIQHDNDIYFIEILLDKIIINDNYNGIIIFDDNLNIIKKIKIFDDLFIYSSYVHNEEILLFCPDNNCMIYININSCKYKVIQLNNGLEDLIFSTFYEWDENGIVLTSYKRDFYKIYPLEKIIQRIDHQEVERFYPELYQKVINKNFITKDENKIFSFNFIDQNIDVLKNVDHFIYHDISYKDGIIALVSENKIKLITQIKTDVIYPNKAFMFLLAKFINKEDNATLIVLSSSKLDAKFSRIDIYQICEKTINDDQFV